jgi:hypothetical protein
VELTLGNSLRKEEKFGKRKVGEKAGESPFGGEPDITFA